MKKKILFLAGPTASGKTKLAIKLAKNLNGEIISCDSMQVYKGPRIITNKPTKKQLRSIRHHLVNELSISKEFDVARFIRLAKVNIRDIHKRNRLPIFVVGTPFYMSSLLDGLIKGAKRDLKLRDRLFKLGELKGREFLYNRLKRIDSMAAEKIHPNDLKKTIRALEVYEKTKTRISKLERKNGIYGNYDIEIICIDLPRGQLYNRINKRTNSMFKRGLIKEIKALLRQKISRTAVQILGFRQIGGYLDGKYSLDEAKRLLARDTRRYAKRQLIWFRKDKRIKWMNEQEIIKYAINRFSD